MVMIFYSDYSSFAPQNLSQRRKGAERIADAATYLRRRSGEKAQRGRNISGRNSVLCAFARDFGSKKLNYVYGCET